MLLVVGYQNWIRFAIAIAPRGTKTCLSTKQKSLSLPLPRMSTQIAFAYSSTRTEEPPRASKRFPAKENEHTAADDEGWMVSGQKILFCWVLVPKLTMVVRVSCYFKLLPTY